MTDNGLKEKRIALFSDTHGNAQAIREALNGCGPFDLIFHLGDGVRDGQRVAGEFQIPFFGVTGNEDYVADLPDREVVTVEQWTFYLLHGHQAEINRYQKKAAFEKRLLKISKTAQTANAQVVLFGHTHQLFINTIHGMTFCNPGNQYFGSSQPPTFALLIVKGDILDISIMINRNHQWKVLEEQQATLHKIP